MKKVLSVVLAVMMLASLSVFAFADVNPSVTTKAAPEADESSVEAEGLEEEGAEIFVELTAIAEAEDEQTKAAIEDAVAAVTEQDALEKAVASAVAVETTGTIAADVYDTAEDAVPAVSDAFFVDAKDANGESVLASEYVEGVTPTVKVRVKVELPKNLIKVLQFVSGTWIEVPVVLNEEGEPVLEISYAGPIVFVYNSNVEVG